MNLIDYVKKNGDKSFKEFPFNEVDALIFSLLPYLNFTNIVPAFKSNKVNFKNAAGLLDISKNRSLFMSNTFKLIQEMRDKDRYKDILLYNYMNVINEEMQFGALTIKIPKVCTFIAFAGTDTSVIGWEEDFKMAYLYPGASQKYASIYLKQAIKLFDYPVMVGGHSKGGNLAISSSMNSKFFIKKKIRAIYNFDGPGFLKEQVESHEYKSIESKIKMYVPHDSIIGMILYHVNNYKVVRAKHFSILQHDAFLWMIDNNTFINAKQNKRSKNLEMKLTKKLEELSIDERLNLVKSIFSFFHENNIKDTQEIKLKNILGLIKSFRKVDKETKNLLLEFLFILFIK